MMQMENFKKYEGVIYRLVSLLLTPVFIANIPILFFLIYMGHHGFFSYDFFSDGVFGLKVFFLITSLYMVMASLALFWFVIPLVKKKFKNTFNLWSFLGILLFNLVFFAFIFMASYISRGILQLVYILAIGLFITLHISFLCYAKPDFQLRSLIALAFVTTAISLMYPEQSVSTLKSALKMYGVGGEVNVSAENLIDTNKKIEGKLILLTPKHMHLKLNGSNDISTIDRSRLGAITVIRDVDKETNQNR